MNAGQPVARGMRVLVRLTLAGGVLMVVGEVLAVAAVLQTPLPWGWSPGAPLASVLIAIGLLCGAAVVALGFTVPGRAGARRPGLPARAARAARAVADPEFDDWREDRRRARSTVPPPADLRPDDGSGHAGGGAAMPGAGDSEPGSSWWTRPGAAASDRDSPDEWLSDIRSAGPVVRRPGDRGPGDPGQPGQSGR